MDHTFPNSEQQNDKELARRKLKRLKNLLIIWLVSFLASILWFSFSPGI
jgi:hypothetical protein